MTTIKENQEKIFGEPDVNELEKELTKAFPNIKTEEINVISDMILEEFKLGFKEGYRTKEAEFENPNWTETQKGMDRVLSEWKKILFHKNKKYGDSAINPNMVFSHADAGEAILVRLNDKIARVTNREKGTKPAKNDMCDIGCYIALYHVAMKWFDFSDIYD